MTSGSSGAAAQSKRIAIRKPPRHPGRRRWAWRCARRFWPCPSACWRCNAMGVHPRLQGQDGGEGRALASRDQKRACPIHIRTIPADNGKGFTDRRFGMRKRTAIAGHAFDRLCAGPGIGNAASFSQEIGHPTFTGAHRRCIRIKSLTSAPPSPMCPLSKVRCRVSSRPMRGPGQDNFARFPPSRRGAAAKVSGRPFCRRILRPEPHCGGMVPPARKIS